MTMKELASVVSMRQLATIIALNEKKKSQATIGDIREILAILSDLVYQTHFDYKVGQKTNIIKLLYQNGEKRHRMKPKKKC